MELHRGSSFSNLSDSPATQGEVHSSKGIKTFLGFPPGQQQTAVNDQTSPFCFSDLLSTSSPSNLYRFGNTCIAAILTFSKLLSMKYIKKGLTPSNTHFQYNFQHLAMASTTRKTLVDTDYQQQKSGTYSVHSCKVELLLLFFLITQITPFALIQGKKINNYRFQALKYMRMCYLMNRTQGSAWVFQSHHMLQTRDTTLKTFLRDTRCLLHPTETEALAFR